MSFLYFLPSIQSWASQFWCPTWRCSQNCGPLPPEKKNIKDEACYRFQGKTCFSAVHKLSILMILTIITLIRLCHQFYQTSYRLTTRYLVTFQADRQWSDQASSSHADPQLWHTCLDTWIDTCVNQSDVTLRCCRNQTMSRIRDNSCSTKWCL